MIRNLMISVFEPTHTGVCASPFATSTCTEYSVSGELQECRQPDRYRHLSLRSELQTHHQHPEKRLGHDKLFVQPVHHAGRHPHHWWWHAGSRPQRRHRQLGHYIPVRPAWTHNQQVDQRRQQLNYLVLRSDEPHHGGAQCARQFRLHLRRRHAGLLKRHSAPGFNQLPQRAGDELRLVRQHRRPATERNSQPVAHCHHSLQVHLWI